MKSKESSSNQYAEIYKSSQSAQENTHKSARTKSQKKTESAESNKAVLNQSETSAALDEFIKTLNKVKSHQSSAKGSKKKDDSSIILQVDDVTKAIMEQLIAKEHNVSSGQSNQRIADLENKITNLTDDLKRCNKRIDELEKELSRVKRGI